MSEMERRRGWTKFERYGEMPRRGLSIALDPCAQHSPSVHDCFESFLYSIDVDMTVDDPTILHAALASELNAC